MNSMQVLEDLPRQQPDPVDAARLAIWRLFQEGYVDEDMATAGLLAVDLGTRRARRKANASRESTRVMRLTGTAAARAPH
jgi:hypothetical protein